MTCVEKILSILEYKKIPVSRMERELGFGNGYIKQLKKGTLPSDRLIAVSNYLRVPMEDLLSDSKERVEADVANYLAKADTDLCFALYGEPADELTREDLNQIREYAEYVRNKRRGATK